MSRKKGIDVKTLIMVSCAVVALVIVVATIIVLGRNEKIDSSYFHDSKEKIVLTMNREMASIDETEWEPLITHIVYYHDGNKINSVKAFYEYYDEKEAKEAYDNLEAGELASNKKLDGRFVIFDINKQQYDGLTVDKLKENIELLKQIDALILNYDETTINNYKEADATIEVFDEPNEASGSSESSAPSESSEN